MLHYSLGVTAKTIQDIYMKLEALDTLLRLALIHEFHDKATIKKMTIKLVKRVQPHVKLLVIDSILTAKDPKQTLVEHIDKFLGLNIAANKINGMGYIGMVVHQGTAYPVRIIVEDENDRHYVLRNERAIAQKTASRFEEELQPNRSTCDVQFFNNRGFSGTRYQVPVGA